MSSKSTWSIVVAVACAAASPVATALSLSPLLSSSTATAAGSQAQFARIDSTWQGSTVYWNESLHQYSATPQPADSGYVRIGSTAWGTGLWGINDFNAVLSGSVPSVATWSGVVQNINFGDGCYDSSWSSVWGPTNLAPLFGAPDTCANGNADPAQYNVADNWVSRFTGYIRVEEAGDYNFSVLYDDGFFFRLLGGNGEELSIAQDFLNPRDRLGFAENIALTPGLYAFELGAYDRLEAGVVDLQWRWGDNDWTLVPPEYLVNIPEPGTLALLSGGLVLLFATSRRRRSAQVVRATDEHA